MEIVVRCVVETDEGLVPESAQYGTYHLLLNVFTASKGFWIFIIY